MSKNDKRKDFEQVARKPVDLAREIGQEPVKGRGAKGARPPQK